MRPDDLNHCQEKIRTGSYSFYAASKLLPASLRDPAFALYAFCRVADDAVDLTQSKAQAVLSLRDRLDEVYAGHPKDRPVDRAFASIIQKFDMPKGLPEALLEGLAWDAEGRRYQSLDELLGYCARVASAVGVMMCVLMRVRDPDALARACDLGLAMQLTNIARDIGEDRLEGRIYIPLDWLAEAGLTENQFFQQSNATDQMRSFAKRLLDQAQHFYSRSEAGISALPFSARTGIFAARYIYAAIGTEVRRNGYDSNTKRATTSRFQKLGWLGFSAAKCAAVSVMPQSALLHARPDPAVDFLIAAARSNTQKQRGWFQRADALLDVLSGLEKDAANMEHTRF